jgi:hypothetical protein
VKSIASTWRCLSAHVFDPVWCRKLHCGSKWGNGRYEVGGIGRNGGNRENGGNGVIDGNCGNGGNGGNAKNVENGRNAKNIGIRANEETKETEAE